LCACNIVGHPSELILTLGSRDDFPATLDISRVDKSAEQQSASLDIPGYGPSSVQAYPVVAGVDAGRPARIISKTTAVK